MKYYRPGPTEDHQGVLCVHGEDWNIFVEHDGTPRAHEWRPVLTRWYGDGERGDLVWFRGHSLVMQRRAVDVLRDMLEAGGEILPLECTDGSELYVLNVTRVLDALDEERSTLWRLPESGKIILVVAPAFHEHQLRDADFFRLPLRAGQVYVSQRFVDRARDAGLEGWKFNLAWSPEGGPVKQHLK